MTDIYEPENVYNAEPIPEQQQVEPEFMQQEDSPDYQTEAEQYPREPIDELNALHEMLNIAEKLTDQELQDIGVKVYDEYHIDMSSMDEWRREILELIDLAKLVSKKRTWAGQEIANIKYPLLIEAAIHFASRAYPEIVKGEDVVRAKIIGADAEGKKAARGKRVAGHLSYQILEKMDDWEEDTDRLLLLLPIIGCVFRKTWNDTVDNTNVSELIYPTELIANYYTRSMKTASRISHVIELTKNDIVEKINSGVFLDIDIDTLGHPEGNTETRDEGSRGEDDEAPYIFIEQHRFLDLDDDGYQEPYIVTIHLDSQKVFRISARFDIDDVITNEKGKIVRIKPVNYFTRYIFMPAIDGGFYGWGWGQMLKSINSSINTTINQLLDSGTLANRQGGFLGKGIRLGRGGSLKFAAGEWKQVDTTGGVLRENIVPLPAQEPSLVLFNLMGSLIQAGKELTSMTDVLTGSSIGKNASPTTTLALIEQSLKIFNGIYKRIFRSLKEEFKKLCRLNKLYLEPQEYKDIVDDPNAVLAIDYKDTDFDIIPVADMSAITDFQRMAKAEMLLQLRGQGLNDQEIVRRYLETMMIGDIEKIITIEEQQPDPVVVSEVEKTQAETQKIIAEIAKIKEEFEKLRQENELESRGLTIAKEIEADGRREKEFYAGGVDAMEGTSDYAGGIPGGE